MKGLFWVAGVLAIVSGGCCWNDCSRALIFEPLEYCDYQQDCLVSAQNYAVAESYWKRQRQQCPEQSCSPDYRQGFLDGFADYLEHGPAGAPPLVPPRRYWNSHFQTPAGQEAMGQWFAGFQDGTAAAQETGYREFRTVPTSLANGLPPHDV